MKRVIIYIITVLFSICAGATLLYAADVYLIKEKPEEPQDKNVIVTDEGISAGIENIYDAVVVIENYQKNKLTATGSGFIYTEDGYIMTNQHVIDKATDIRVLLSNGERITAKLIGGDKYADIAVLQIDKEKVKKVAKLGSSEKTKLGDTVFTIGSPMSSAYAGTVTRGILSGKNRLVEVAIEGKTNDWIMNVMQTDAAINPGNSGGPLCNVNGEVIGVNSLKITKSEIEGIGFAIPIEEALEYANDIKNGKKVEVAYLGIQMSMFLLIFAFLYADRKYALKVPTNYTPRIKRLLVAYYFITACVVYFIIAFLAFLNELHGGYLYGLVENRGWNKVCYV